MHKASLNDEQICKLIGFIESRGFHDPGVIVEILDHFACKVEEKLTADPRLSLESAMANAHADFGVIGFYYLQANYEANTRKKYKSIYRAERKKILLNPAIVIISLILAFLVYKAFGWAEIHANLWGSNLVSDLLFVYFMAATIFAFVKFKIPKRRNKITQSIMSGDIVGSIFVTSLASQFGPHAPKGIVILSVLSALVFFYITIRSLAIYATFKSGKKEMDLVYNYLARKGNDKLNLAQ